MSETEKNKGGNSQDESKLDFIIKQLTSIAGKLDIQNARINAVEKQLSDKETRICDLERGLSHVEEELMARQVEIDDMKSHMVNKKEFLVVKKKLVDLSNRSRRNNIVVHGLDEKDGGFEDDNSLKDAVHTILRDNLGIHREIAIERIHRTPAKKNPAKLKPRMVHAKILNWADRDDIIRKAPKALKSTKYFITDDIDPVSRKEEDILKIKMRKMREDGKLAFIPFVIPRVLKYKDPESPSLKTLRLTREEEDACLL